MALAIAQDVRPGWNYILTPDANGLLATYTTNRFIDVTNPFFQSLGTNGRSCATCHVITDGWTINPESVQLRFNLTAGRDPIFRPVDGSNCDNLDVSTVETRRSAYSLLLQRGLIRVALQPVPGAEFTVTAVANPYGCNSTTTVSMYRRPLPSTNLRFLSTVMFDGRESTPPGTQKITYTTNPGDLLADLAHQALDATNGHAQAATPLTTQQQQQIVDFEMGLFTAQAFANEAGPLDLFGAGGGPTRLAAQQFFVGINDPLGQNPLGTPFTPVVFTLFNAWQNLPAQDRRAAIARGEALFNSKTIHIQGVGGLNDALGIADIPGTCGTCHDTPNVGNHSVSAPLNIGVADVANPLGVSYLPVITLRNNATGATVQTTDPGRAMITGKWADIGKVKGPILRGLSARAPYFHNGSASTLEDAVRFYDSRFHIGFTEQEIDDLVAFLKTL